MAAKAEMYYADQSGGDTIVKRTDLSTGAADSLQTIPGHSIGSMAVDSSGNVYLAEKGQKTIWKISGDSSRTLTRVDNIVTSGITDLAVTDTGVIFASLVGASAAKLSPFGGTYSVTYIPDLGLPTYGTDATAVAVDGAGNAYITTGAVASAGDPIQGASHLWKWSPDGSVSSLADFNDAQSVAVSRDGVAYVGDNADAYYDSSLHAAVKSVSGTTKSNCIDSDQVETNLHGVAWMEYDSVANELYVAGDGTLTDWSTETYDLTPHAAVAFAHGTAPSTPGNLALGSLTRDGTAATMTYSTVSGMNVTYTGRAVDASNPNNIVTAQCVDRNSLTLTGLDPDTRYKVSVRATTPGGITGAATADVMLYPHHSSDGHTCAAGTTLAPGTVYTTGTGNDITSLTMQYDGNLVMCDASNQLIWASNTSGNGGATATFGTDGILRISKSAANGGRELWSSANDAVTGATFKFSGYELSILRNDGSLAWTTTGARTPLT
ncbi:hypothetical protein OHV05_37405 (plasmid) [Kitasatospora sp. NBC_00070]|uniref:hypothetical protein n=1 Tax=Kitasatospora sp. NBC_00070 TaxID=2975962 RepID=UPI0032474C96